MIRANKIRLGGQTTGRYRRCMGVGATQKTISSAFSAAGHQPLEYCAQLHAWLISTARGRCKM